MSWVQEAASRGPLGIGETIKGFAGIATLGALAFGSIKRIPKNHRGIPTVRENPERTWGRKAGQRYKTRGSGLVFVWPFVGGVESRSMQRQHEELPKFDVMCTDGKQVADASIVWHVKNEKDSTSEETRPTTKRPSRLSKEYLKPAFYGTHARMLARYMGEPYIVPSVSEADENLYRSLFEMEKDKLNNFIISLARTGIVAAAREITSDDLLVPNAAMAKTQELYGETLDAHGVAIDGIYVTSFGASEAQVQVNGVREIWGRGPEDDSGTAEKIGQTLGGVSPPLHSVPGVGEAG